MPESPDLENVMSSMDKIFAMERPMKNGLLMRKQDSPTSCWQLGAWFEEAYRSLDILHSAVSSLMEK